MGGKAFKALPLVEKTFFAASLTEKLLNSFAGTFLIILVHQALSILDSDSNSGIWMNCLIGLLPTILISLPFDRSLPFASSYQSGVTKVNGKSY